jgi:glutamate decarboxylase
MSLELLDRLISDAIAVTQTLAESDLGGLAALQRTATSTEEQHQSQGVDSKHRKKHGSKRPMSEGAPRDGVLGQPRRICLLE